VVTEADLSEEDMTIRDLQQAVAVATQQRDEAYKAVDNPDKVLAEKDAEIKRAKNREAYAEGMIAGLQEQLAAAESSQIRHQEAEIAALKMENTELRAELSAAEEERG
jgi:chromosome segregation ATPase